MIIHQSSNSLFGNYNGVLYGGCDYDNHFHRSFEFISVYAGEILVTVGNEKYDLRCGESVFIPPFVAHSIKAASDSIVFIAVFAGDHVDDVSGIFRKKRAESYKFKLSENGAKYIRDNLCPHIDILPNGAALMPPPKKIRLKSCLYAICSEFLDVAVLRDNMREDELVFDMISYVESNYLDDIRLKDMARSLGYSHEYISRVFNRLLGINFKELVNQYRLEHAMGLIEKTDEPLVSIAMMSGFQSIRSFNRVCRELVGASPGEIRKKSVEEK